MNLLQVFTTGDEEKLPTGPYGDFATEISIVIPMGNTSPGTIISVISVEVNTVLMTTVILNCHHHRRCHCCHHHHYYYYYFKNNTIRLHVDVENNNGNGYNLYSNTGEYIDRQ